MSVTEIKLQIPVTRLQDVAWLVDKNPWVVCDMLCIAKCVFDTSHSMWSAQREDWLRELLSRKGETSEGTNSAIEKRVEALTQERVERAGELQKRCELAEKQFNEALEALTKEKQQLIDDHKDDILKVQREMAEKVEQQQAENLARQEELKKIRDEQVAFYEDHMQRQEAQLLKQVQVMKDAFDEQYAQLQRANESEIKASQLREEQLHMSLSESQRTLAQLREEYSSKLVPMLAESTTALKTFCQDSRKGVIGENVVRHAFERMNVGYLEDVRHSHNEPGCEDYLWTIPTESMRCSIEVKWVQRIHTQKDMQKHMARIEEASRHDKITCGLFLSLLCPVPNMKQVDIKVFHNTPVLYVSGGDGLSPQMVAETGLRFVRAILPFLRCKGKEDQEASDDSSEASQGARFLQHMLHVFESQMKGLVAIEKELTSMNRQCAALHKSIEKLRKLRQDIVSGIEISYIEHPSLLQTTFAADGLDGEESSQCVPSVTQDAVVTRDVRAEQKKKRNLE